ncbi:MAG TPA: FAD-binding oxidoreductase [Chloroflexota bacterium]|nr:FAD-binding oxidoreductase [Chloroflexota bacterium]
MSATAAHRTFALGDQAPRTVVRPETPQAVAETLRQASEAGQAVVPWGAGTKQGWGNAPRAYDLALDLSALDRILEYEPADLVVTVQAGTPLGALQRRLGEAGQFLALDPPYAAYATLGGTLATNASGPSRLLYGTARDLVLGMQVATPAGDLVKSGGKVVKNVVGYDLNKMHIGGLGTLGVMTEVTFKVHPLPRAEATVGATFGALGPAQEVAGRLFRSVLYPRAVELLRAPVPGLDGGPGEWRVLVWCAGSPATVERQAGDAGDWLQEAGATSVVRLDGDAHRALWDEVREFGRALPPHVALVKLTALPTRVPDLIAAAGRAAGEQDAAPQIAAHAGSGVLYAALPGVSLTALQTLIEEARALGGAAVVEACPPALGGGLDVWGPTRDDFPLMQALKAQFDPSGTLNPGRFLGGI